LPYTVKEDSNSNSININNKPYLYLSDSAVDNYEDCEYFKVFKRLYEKNLGFAYPIIDEWLLEKSKEIDILLFKRAIAICSEKSTMDLSYLKGILKRWKTKNICTYNQLEAYEGCGKSKNKSACKTESNSTEVKSSGRSKKTAFHNFEELLLSTVRMNWVKLLERVRSRSLVRCRLRVDCEYKQVYDNRQVRLPKLKNGIRYIRVVYTNYDLLMETRLFNTIRHFKLQRVSELWRRCI
jgi:DnaD/phage-associated family protein